MPVPRAQVDSGITIPHGTSPAVIFPTLDGATTTGAHTTASTIPQVPSTPLALMGKRYFPVRTLGEGSFGEVFLVEDRGGVDDANSTTTLSGSTTATTTTGTSTFLSSTKLNTTAGDTTASSATSMSPNSSGRHARYPLYVIKRLKQPFDRMAKREVDEARAEIASITKLKHPNVVGFHRAWFDAKDYRLHMLLEYCEEGDLHEFMKRNHPLSEDLLRSLMVQMMAGLAFIHSQRTMHRDIKLQNIFVTSQKVAEPDGKGGFISSRPLVDLDHRAIQHIVSDDDGYARILKIGDFGLSKSLVKTEECAKTTAGTPFHFSPELARRAPYTSKNDVWSMGVAFYYMMTSTMPFQGRTIPEVVRAVISQDLPPPAQRYLQMFRQPIPYSGMCQQLVIGMLRKDPAQRPTASEILDLAPFFVGIEESRRRRAVRVNAVRAQQQIMEARAERRSSQQRNSPINNNNVSAEPSRRTSPLSGASKVHAIPAPPSRPRPTAVPPTQQLPPAGNIIVAPSSQQQHHQGIAPPPLAHKRVVQLRFIYSEALVAVRIAPFHGTESVGALRCGDIVSVEATSASRRGGATSTDRVLEPVLYGGGPTPPPPSKNSNSPPPSPMSIIEQPRWYRILTPVEGFCIAYLPTLSATPPSSNTRRPTSNTPATDAAPLRPLFERTDVSPPTTSNTNPAKQPRTQAARILPPTSSDDDDNFGDDNNHQGGRVRRCELPEMLMENPDDFLSRVSVLIPHSSDDEDGDQSNMYSQVEGVFGRGHIGESCSSNEEDETSSDDELVIVDGVTGERIHHPDSKIANRTNNTTAVFAGGAPPPPLPQEDQYHFIGGGVGRVVRAPSSGGAEVGFGIVSKPPSPVISRRQSPLSLNDDGKPRSPQSRKAKIVETVTTPPSSDYRKQHTTSPPQAGTPPSTRQSKKG